MTKYLDFATLPSGLERIVLARLSQEQKYQARLELIVFSVIDLVSLAGLLASIIYLANVFAQSGFNQYLSLIFSDSDLLASYWQELTLSLAESLPVLGLVAFLSVLTVLIWSMSKTIINARVLTMQYD